MAPNGPPARWVHKMSVDLERLSLAQIHVGTRYVMHESSRCRHCPDRRARGVASWTRPLSWRRTPLRPRPNTPMAHSRCQLYSTASACVACQHALWSALIINVALHRRHGSTERLSADSCDVSSSTTSFELARTRGRSSSRPGTRKVGHEALVCHAFEFLHANVARLALGLLLARPRTRSGDGLGVLSVGVVLLRATSESICPHICLCPECAFWQSAPQYLVKQRPHFLPMISSGAAQWAQLVRMIIWGPWRLATSLAALDLDAVYPSGQLSFRCARRLALFPGRELDCAALDARDARQVYDCLRCFRSAAVVLAAPTPRAAMAFLETQWWQLHGRGCLAWTGGGLIINELFKRFGSKRSQEVIAGSPRFSWWNGLIIYFSFRVLCGLCVAEHGGPLTRWLRSYGNEYYFHRMFHHAFFGYLVKDLTLPITPVLLATASSALGLCWLHYADTRQTYPLYFAPASRPWNSGRSLASSRNFPKNRTLHLLLFPWMTASNFISASFGVWYSLHYENVGLASRIIFPVVGIGLCAARRAVENARFRNWTRGKMISVRHAQVVASTAFRVCHAGSQGSRGGRTNAIGAGVRAFHRARREG